MQIQNPPIWVTFLVNLPALRTSLLYRYYMLHKENIPATLQPALQETMGDEVDFWWGWSSYWDEELAEMMVMIVMMWNLVHM